MAEVSSSVSARVGAITGGCSVAGGGFDGGGDGGGVLVTGAIKSRTIPAPGKPMPPPPPPPPPELTPNENIPPLKGLNAETVCPSVSTSILVPAS